MHFPGFRVASPMTPKEYELVWEDFMANDDPMIVSEHRLSYSNAIEMNDIIAEKADITLFAISSTRFEVNRAAEMLSEDGIVCNVVHIVWLKPFIIDDRLTIPLIQSGRGMVIDPGYEITGASRSLAYELNMATGCSVRALGLYDRTKCLSIPLQNRAPDAGRIYEAAREMLTK